MLATVVLVTGLLSAGRANAELFAQVTADHGAEVGSRAFESASVKPSEPGSLRGSTFEFLPGGGLRIRNGTLRAILETAYGIPEFQILGGAAWVNSEQYDILARSADGRQDSQDDIKAVRLRLQTLLAQRFKLQVHREIRDIPEYALAVAKNGSKLASDDTTSISAKAGIQRSCGQLIGTQTTIANLTTYLAKQSGRPVLDRTGLAGRYSFQLVWMPDAGPCPGATDDNPTIFTALQEQLGLKLESIKGPVDALVIDRAERPDAN
jgi:uncharacterized protein (TIGR03435 family)